MKNQQNVGEYTIHGMVWDFITPILWLVFWGIPGRSWEGTLSGVINTSLPGRKLQRAVGPVGRKWGDTGLGIFMETCDFRKPVSMKTGDGPFPKTILLIGSELLHHLGCV